MSSTLKDVPPELLEEAFRAAEEIGVKLEMVAGIPIWEAHPVIKHQRDVDRIRRTLRPTTGAGSGCGCVHYADINIQFPDGSQKRPDISIFCREPDEQDRAVTLVPEAVIEILSKGFEAKDLEIGVPFYLSQGVKDVVVLNPYTREVIHFRAGTESRQTSPVEIHLACGCVCSV